MSGIILLYVCMFNNSLTNAINIKRIRLQCISFNTKNKKVTFNEVEGAWKYVSLKQ